MMRRASLPIAAVLLFAIAVALSACGGDRRPTVLVAAASDLRFVFEEMEPQFEARCECNLEFSFGSSGMLATQIANGLKVDVFASADSDYVEELESAGLIRPETRQLYAIGRIAIAVPADSAAEPESLEDLRDLNLRRISIANPDHAPYGKAAKQAMQEAGVWEAVEGRLVLGENASLATQFVETGNVDAGIVPLSLTIGREAYLRAVLVDESLHDPLRQEAAVLSSSEHAGQARAFLDFINGEGHDLMRQYGFVLPGESLRR
jgi:molybdate transport system substrate-binding protein